MGKYHDVELDSCLWARIISPSVDNSQDVKKLSWAWFNLIILGVPNSSRTFDLDLKSLPVLIIIMIWTVAVWCSYLFQNIRNAMRSQHFGMKGREIRLMLTRYAPWWQISDGFLLRVYFLYFLTVKLTEDWPRMWTVAFSISPGHTQTQPGRPRVFAWDSLVPSPCCLPLSWS